MLEQCEHGSARVVPGAPIWIGIRDEVRVRRDPEVLPVGALAGIAQGADAPSRIGAGEGDHVPAAGGGSRELDGHLVRHRAGDRQQDAVELRRRNRMEPLVELGPYLGRRRRRAVRQHARLRTDRLGHARVAVADVRHGEAGIEVEVGAAIRIPDVAALRPRPDDRLRLPEGAHAGALECADPLAHVLRRRGHSPTIVRLCARANCCT